MLSLFSTLGGLLISGLPKLLDFFQNKADQKHELALANIQVQMQLQMMAQGFKAQERNSHRPDCHANRCPDDRSCFGA